MRIIGGQAEKAAEAGGTSVEDRLEQLEAELQTCREELRLVIRACLFCRVAESDPDSIESVDPDPESTCFEVLDGLF